MRNIVSSSSRILVLIAILFLGAERPGTAAGWFDGLPDEALAWIYENAAATGSWHNARIARFGDLEIVIHFFDGTEGHYETRLENQGYWDDDGGEQTPVWVDNWVEVEVWVEGEPGYYWIKITLIEEGTVKYISGVWKNFSSKDEIIKEVKSAESIEDKESRLAYERWYSHWSWLMGMYGYAFSTGVPGENRAPLVSSETPVATADKTALRIVDQLVTLRTVSRSQRMDIEESRDDKARMVSGIITYEDFEYYAVDGETFEVLSELQFGVDDWTYGFLIPVSYIDVDFADWTKLGLTAYLKREFVFDRFDVSLGLTAAGEQTWMNAEDVDDSLGYGGGPLFSLNTGFWGMNLSLGANYLYMDNTEYDATDILTTAVSLGVPLGERYAVNLYAYRTDNLDTDNDYWTWGGSATYAVSNVFGMVLGVNTVSELDHFDSTTVHLGGNWRY
jgi:hypothetical protein